VTDILAKRFLLCQHRAREARKYEAQLNQFPQFTAAIDGQNLHFLHVRSPEPSALPLILTHGWPGSIAEFMHILGPLTDPRTRGADALRRWHTR
jgi:hypothetical protein